MGLLDRLRQVQGERDARRSADLQTEAALVAVESDSLTQGWFTAELVKAELEIIERSPDGGPKAAQAALALRVQMAALQLAALQARRTDRLTRSLSRATWLLAGTTLVLVLVTVFAR